MAPEGGWHRTCFIEQETAFAEGWRIPWVLANARPLPKPVPYEHPSGAVIWVNLRPEIAARVEAQLR